MVGVAAAAGIAFTVSLFVADLAFVDRPELIERGEDRASWRARRSPALLGYLLLRAAGRRD